VSSYTYAYAFFQLPYGVITVTVMSVVTPDLAERWSTGQRSAFLRRMTGGLRAVLALIIPSAVGMLLLARPAVALLLGVGHSTPAETATTGAALAMFALGLPGFCAYLYFVRVLQSMQRTRVAFYLYLVENGLNIVLALLLVHPLGVRGLALSLSASTSVGGLLARVVGSVVAGGLTFGAVVIWLGRRHDTHRRPPSRPVGPSGPLGPVRPVPPGPPGAVRRVASSRQAESDPPPPGSADALPRLA
jgi:peptidoglycan biosynthesis protein MviN/MurJ (putative lipid II flippase)